MSLRVNFASKISIEKQSLGLDTISNTLKSLDLTNHI